MSFCIKCGKPLDEGAYSCRHCGAPAGLSIQTAAGAPRFAPPREYTFINTGLGLVVFGALFIVIFVLGAASRNFFAPQNTAAVFRQWSIIAPVAFAAVLTSRAKGPDLSLGPVMALSSIITALLTHSSGSPALGLVVAVVIAAFLGFINGLASVFLRVPAVLITIVTGVMASGISYGLTDGRTITGSLPEFGQTEAIIIIPLAALLIAFLMVLLTKLGAPGEKRSGESGFIFVLAYVASSVIASLAGFGQLSRVGLASPSIGTGYETLIIFVFACALLSRALDNRYVPVLFAMLPAMFWVLLNNVLILLNISSLIQISLNAALALLFLVIAYTVQSDALKATFGFKKRP